LVVVLISGRGSNMQALLDAGVPVSAVISNRAEAEGLAIAGRAASRRGSWTIAVARA
jgi:folate-dependent phosphoribosylglycinamide formyltransferase PurN